MPSPTLAQPVAETTTGPAPQRAKWADRLFDPVPIEPLVQFRVALGLILLWEAYRYISAGWPGSLYLEPEFLFKYYGFEWVRPLPPAMHWAVFYGLGAAALMFATGTLYRLAGTFLFFAVAYLFLLEQALYLNHLYLVTMITGVTTCLPAHRAVSVDALMRPSLRASHVPRWTIAVLRCQIGFVYFFGGVAKLNPDWLSAVPMQMMLLERADLVGQIAGEPWAARLFAYGGLLFDLLIVPVLWWPRTRWLGLLMVLGFHLTNHVLFRIGIFPWFMLAATLLLWPPFRLSLLNFLRIYAALVLVGMALTEVAGREVPIWGWTIGAPILVLFIASRWFYVPALQSERLTRTPEYAAPSRGMRWVVVCLLTLYLGTQLLLPLRHWAYPGDVSWNELGHKWAWHMKLRIKYPVVEHERFFVLDREGRMVVMHDPFAEDSPLTFRQAQTMSTRPELIVQYAHFLAEKYKDAAPGPLQVTANILVSLNGRQPQHLVDPEADLAAVEPALWPPPNWILPLEVPAQPLTRVDVERFLQLRSPESENEELPD